jgi:hypothetical protein
MSDPNHWQPLTYVNSTGDLMTQKFLGAQWCDVTPFALSKGDEFRALAESLGPVKYGTPDYQRQAEQLVDLSAGLTDRQKMIAEYWMDGPNSEQPPGHWMLFAQFVSARDHHSLDDDVKMFFALSNAIFDAGIAAWDMKRAYDSVRPATAIPFLFRGHRIRAWGGPGQGTVEMDRSGFHINLRAFLLHRSLTTSLDTAHIAPQLLPCFQPGQAATDSATASAFQREAPKLSLVLRLPGL